MRIGTEVIAKVHEVRARGLALDLGNGIRGLYRFKTDEPSDYEVGDRMRVVCTSFNNKGITLMQPVLINKTIGIGGEYYSAV